VLESSGKTKVSFHKVFISGYALASGHFHVFIIGEFFPACCCIGLVGGNSSVNKGCSVVPDGDGDDFDDLLVNVGIGEYRGRSEQIRSEQAKEGRRENGD
jgi:hypothetical protein